MGGNLFGNPALPVPEQMVRLVELRPPDGFRVDDPGTWPRIPGRLEFVAGRLVWMSPCGDVQQSVAAMLVAELVAWSDAHPEFTVGANEAGMILGGEARGADAAVWRVQDVPAFTGGFRRVAPVLASEVAGEGEDEAQLREKARWYLAHGVSVVWLLLPESREVVVLTQKGDSRAASGQVPASDDLPGLRPEVSRFFRRLPQAH